MYRLAIAHLTIPRSDWKSIEMGFGDFEIQNQREFKEMDPTLNVTCRKGNFYDFQKAERIETHELSMALSRKEQTT